MKCSTHASSNSGFKSYDPFFVLKTFWCAFPILSFSAFNNLIFLPQYKCHEKYWMLIFKDQTGRKRWAAQFSNLNSWNFSFKNFILAYKSLGSKKCSIPLCKVEVAGSPPISELCYLQNNSVSPSKAPEMLGPLDHYSYLNLWLPNREEFRAEACWLLFHFLCFR